MQTHSFYLSEYIYIDVLNTYAKIHPCIIYSFVRITEWSWNFSKIWTFYMTLSFKPVNCEKNWIGSIKISWHKVVQNPLIYFISPSSK